MPDMMSKASKAAVVVECVSQRTTAHEPYRFVVLMLPRGH